MSGAAERVYQVYVDEAALDDDAKTRLFAMLLGHPALPHHVVLRLHSAESLAALHARATQGSNLTLLAECRFADRLSGKGLVCFPPEAQDGDIEDYGMALADAVVLPGSGAAQAPRQRADSQGEAARGADPLRALASRADKLGKAIIAPEALLEPIGQLGVAVSADTVEKVEALRGLDPRTDRSRLSWWLRFRFKVCERAGRLDPVIIDLLAGVTKALRISRHGRPARWHFVKAWRGLVSRSAIDPYFAPERWREICPSDPLLDEGAVVEAFEWLDRAAVSGARKFRSAVWVLHASAFAAILFALIGSLQVHHGTGPAPAEGGPHGGALFAGLNWTSALCSLGELISLLLIVGLVSQLHRSRMQYQWTACRVGAEQLRIVRMALPLLVVPQSLLSPDSERAVGGVDDHSPAARPRNEEGAVALAFVKRAVREYGPVRMRADTRASDGAQWVKCIVDDQLAYHRDNHDRLSAVEHLLRGMNWAIFLAVFVAVTGSAIVHFGRPDLDIRAMLIVTAGFPALAAALHGAAGRLEIGRRAELSERNRDDLAKASDALQKFIDAQSDNWVELRKITEFTLKAMVSEADAWHANMTLEPLNLPA